MTHFKIKNGLSVAISESLQEKVYRHLRRNDGQEDLCFALWYPSWGYDRHTALIQNLILPYKGDRAVHGNASFNSVYFERAIAEALKNKAGLAFMHSHLAPGWQGMSFDDINAEKALAPMTLAATGLPLVGTTMGMDGAWSGRFWEKEGPKKYKRIWCESVRVVGKAFHVTFMDELIPKPRFKVQLTRTISVWGEQSQWDLARLRIGIVGAGSVGSIVAESLARMGIQHIKLIDFDRVKFLNLDRTLHATEGDARVKRYKVDVLKRALKRSATADNFEVDIIKKNLVTTQVLFEKIPAVIQ